MKSGLWGLAYESNLQKGSLSSKISSLLVWSYLSQTQSSHLKTILALQLLVHLLILQHILHIYYDDLRGKMIIVKKSCISHVMTCSIARQGSLTWTEADDNCSSNFKPYSVGLQSGQDSTAVKCCVDFSKVIRNNSL